MDFVKKHSTEYAAIKLVDHISKEIESGKTPCALFTDLSKAFDTLSFDILIRKLRQYCVMDTDLRLLISYLTNRKQYVRFIFYYYMLHLIITNLILRK